MIDPRSLFLIAFAVVAGYIPTAYICARFIKQTDDAYIKLLKKGNWLHLLPSEELEELQTLYMAQKCVERIWAAQVKDTLEAMEVE